MVHLKKITPDERIRLEEIKNIFKIKTDAGAIRKLIRYGRI